MDVIYSGYDFIFVFVVVSLLLLYYFLQVTRTDWVDSWRTLEQRRTNFVENWSKIDSSCISQFNLYPFSCLQYKGIIVYVIARAGVIFGIYFTSCRYSGG